MASEEDPKPVVHVHYVHHIYHMPSAGWQPPILTHAPLPGYPRADILTAPGFYPEPPEVAEEREPKRKRRKKRG